MLEEREGEARLASDSGHSGAKGVGHFAEIIGALVGELLPLDVAPQQLDGVEIGGITGEPLDGQPRALATQVGDHRPALVSGQAIPDENEAVAAEMALEGLQERDEVLAVVAAGSRLEEEAPTLAVPSKGQGHADRQLAPVVGMDQDRRLATRCPGAPDRWSLGDAAFVLEDEPRPLASGVFFTAGQRVETHCRTAASFRSFACLAGRWSVQSNARRRRHTCAG